MYQNGRKINLILFQLNLLLHIYDAVYTRLLKKLLLWATDFTDRNKRFYANAVHLQPFVFFYVFQLYIFTTTPLLC